MVKRSTTSKTTVVLTVETKNKLATLFTLLIEIDKQVTKKMKSRSSSKEKKPSEDMARNKAGLVFYHKNFIFKLSLQVHLSNNHDRHRSFNII